MVQWGQLREGRVLLASGCWFLVSGVHSSSSSSSSSSPEMNLEGRKLGRTAKVAGY
jgi:hypothetical protein